MDDQLRDVDDVRPVIIARQPPPLLSSIELVCLNFKVPLRVRQRFKIYAARHNMTMTEMLLQLLDERLSSDANIGVTRPPLIEQEIKK